MLVIAPFLLLCATESAAAVRDTIIIDGFVITIQQEVTYDTVFVAKNDTVIPPLNPQKPPKQVKKKKPAYEFLFSPGLSIGELRASESSGFSTVGELVDNRRPVGSVLGLGGRVVLPSGNEWAMKTGLSLMSRSVALTNFNPESADDSLWKFLVPERGLLDQVLKFDYGILGAETDTIPMPLNRAVVRELMIAVPISVARIWEQGKKGNSIELDLGGVLRFRKAMAGAPLILIGGDQLYTSVSPERFETSAFDFALSASLTHHLFLRPKQRFFYGAGAMLPITYRISSDERFSNPHWMLTGIVGFKFMKER